MISKIVSGGQTGADRAALDVTLKYGFPHGGWCPKGRMAEDGPIRSAYVLAESKSKNYLQRTEWNARDTDGTVVFTMKSAVTGGSKRTIDFAKKHTKPWLHLYPEMDEDPVEALLRFVERHRIQTLNVAGSRGSKEPQLHGWVCNVLEAAFFATDAQRAIAAALRYLGPEIEVSEVSDNDECPIGYGAKQVKDCWRIYYQLKDDPGGIVGGSDLYLLVEKETGRILGKGTEPGE